MEGKSKIFLLLECTWLAEPKRSLGSRSIRQGCIHACPQPPWAPLPRGNKSSTVTAEGLSRCHVGQVITRATRQWSSLSAVTAEETHPFQEQDRSSMKCSSNHHQQVIYSLRKRCGSSFVHVNNLEILCFGIICYWLVSFGTVGGLFLNACFLHRWKMPSYSKSNCTPALSRFTINRMWSASIIL